MQLDAKHGLPSAYANAAKKSSVSIVLGSEVICTEHQNNGVLELRLSVIGPSCKEYVITSNEASGARSLGLLAGLCVPFTILGPLYQPLV